MPLNERTVFYIINIRNILTTLRAMKPSVVALVLPVRMPPCLLLVLLWVVRPQHVVSLLLAPPQTES